MAYGGRTVMRTVAALALAVLLVVPASAAASAATAGALPFAGDGVAGDRGDGGEPAQARLRTPAGVAVAGAAEVYIADTGNHRIRRVRHGVITTVAGTGQAGAGGDGGPAAAARFNRPTGLAVDAAGGLLIADSGNAAVRRLRDGLITAVAGSGVPGYSGDGGPATLARLRDPHGVAVGPDGAVYIADTGNHVIRKVDPSGHISTVAGTGEPGHSGDGGPATAGRLQHPSDVVVTASGALLVADTGNSVVRRIDPDGTLSTLAGSGVPGYAGDGAAASHAALHAPTGLALDRSGRLLIADTGNAAVRRVDLDGTITTVAGSVAAGTPGPPTPLAAPAAVAAAAGVLLIADVDAHSVRLVVASPPPAPELHATTPASPANNNFPRVLGRAPGAAEVRLYADPWCTTEVGAGPAAELETGGIVVQVPDDRTTALYATAVHVTGVRSGCSGPLRYVEDSTAPDPPIITESPQAGDPRPTWHFSAEPGAQVECQLAAAMVIEPYSPCRDSFTYDLSGQPAVSYTFSVRAIDAAGNVGPAATATHTPRRASSDVTLPPPGRPDPPAPQPPDATGSVDAPDAAGPTDPGWSSPPAPLEGDAAAPEDQPAAGAPADGAPTAGLSGGDADSGALQRRAGAGPSAGRYLEDAGSSGGRAIRSSVLASLLTVPLPSLDDGEPAPRPGLLHPQVLLGALARMPVLPVLSVLAVAAFLLLQHRFDRRDPKLALAPVRDEVREFSPLVPVRSRA